MTTEEINALADILLRELDAVEDHPHARSWRRVLVTFALQGVHLQTVADSARAPAAPLARMVP
jgi:hypothetical protein